MSLPLKHGEANKTPEYKAWKEMRSRCFCKTDPAYSRYGGRGITVCDRWADYEAFLADVGRKPTPLHSLDRFPNNNGDYEPNNIRWATATEQSRNRRCTLTVTFAGATRTLVEWGDKTGISYEVLYNRIFVKHWPAERALTSRPRHHNGDIHRYGNSLSFDQLQEIKGSPERQRILALRYGVSGATISRIKTSALDLKEMTVMNANEITT